MPDNHEAIDIFRGDQFPQAATVRTARITGANRYGRTLAETVEDRTSTRPQEILEWIARAPEYMHSVEVPLPQLSLRAHLSRSRPGEALVVQIGERQGVSPRSVDGHHAVSTDYNTLFDLIVKLDLDQLAMFDRGVVWVKLHEDSAPSLVFNVNPGRRSVDEIQGGVLQMLTRVGTVLTDLAHGMP